MKDYIIIVDSASDIPKNLRHEYNIEVLGLKCILNNKEYIEDDNMELSYDEFYKAIREGAMPTTSQVNLNTYYKVFEKHVKEGKTVIYPAFSSALSGCYNASLLAREDVLEKYPEADIRIFDTKCASLGYGLLIIKAMEYAKKGASCDEVYNFLIETAPNINHIVLLDDLSYLKRGGRLSGTAAVLGSLLMIKPLVKMNENGELINYSKVKGRKKGINTLFEEFENKAVDINNQKVVAICHSDCLDDAQKLAKMITDKYNLKVIIGSIGCVIGSHTGASTMALFFVGNGR